MSDFAVARRGGAPCEVEETEQGGPREQMDLHAAAGAIGAERISRRGFLQGATLVAGGLAVAVPEGATAQENGSAAAAEVKKMPLAITINGERKQLEVDPRVNLLDLLREQLGLTGSKKGCGHGQCGACTVIADGRRINSCLSLALVHQGGEITTIEGIAHGEDLHPVQEAFLEHDGYQCGYCTPGQVVSAVALLDEAKKGQPSQVTADLRKTGPVELTAEEIKERMSGNICRCGAYPGIVAAVEQAWGNGARA